MVVLTRGSAPIMPEALPSCFRESLAVENPSTRHIQNSVICLYETSIDGCYSPVTVTWSKSLVGPGFSVTINDISAKCTCKVDVMPWLFWKKQGSKSAMVGEKKMEVFWNMSTAKYFNSSPEPKEGFFLALVYEKEIVLFLGDMQKEALKKIRAVQSTEPIQANPLSRKEHLFGKKCYNTKAQFCANGPFHDIAIECHTSKGPQLSIKVDGQSLLQVQHLAWKFRGNETIMVDSNQIEVFWDVHNWLFDHSNQRNAVFMFQACTTNNDIDAEETKEETPRHSLSSLVPWKSFKDKDTKWFTESSCSSVLRWPNTHSFKDSHNCFSKFSLLLFAWRND